MSESTQGGPGSRKPHTWFHLRDEVASLTVEEVQRLIYELRLRIVELEMQNEELRRAQHEVDNRRNRFRALYNSAPVACIATERGGVIAEANFAACDLLKVERDSLSGKSIYDFAWTGNRSKLRNHLASACEREERRICEIWMSDAETKRYLVRFETVAAEADGSRYCNIALVDISDRSRDEERLRRREAELLRLNAQLVAESRRKDEFLAMLAHELRNPLAALTYSLPLRTSGNEEVRSWAQGVAARQTKQLASLVDDLLDASRITKGKIKLRRRKTDGIVIVRAAVESLRAAAAERKHQVKLDLPVGPVIVDVDPSRLEQIVVNLVANAIKYTPLGGRIVVAVRAVDDRMEIEVADNGIGLEPQMLERVFEPFAQAEGAIERSCGGLGIGLTLVRRLSELHGGSVQAASAGAGKGASFVVSLPIVAPEAAARRDLGARLNGGERSSVPPEIRRVLIVEDNEDTGQGMLRLLESVGLEVRLESNGAQALAAAAAFVPHVILLDIGLPDIDGYELARQLRRSDSIGDVFIVAVSGFSRPEDRARAYDAGCDYHLVKPVDFGELYEVIKGGKPRAERSSV